MSPILFSLFAAMMLGFGVAVVANRNPVASALCLVGCFLGLAALFVGLDAYFIAVIQVLVYAGAVMVLFLFIIMLLDLKAEERRKFNPVALVGGGVVSLAFVSQLIAVLRQFPKGHEPFPALNLDSLPNHRLDDVRVVGETLFSVHTLSFQVVGVLILVATIGVILLSKRELK